MANAPAPPSPRPVREETPVVVQEDPVAVGTLLDITGDDPFISTPSRPLTNNETDLFNLDFDSVAPPPPPPPTNDLLGVDFTSMPLEKPILHRNASENVLPAPIQATMTILKSETKSSSNQNIDRLDPFKDLFSMSSTKTSSYETLADQKAAAVPPTKAPPSMPNFNVNLINKPAPTPPPVKSTPPPARPAPAPAAKTDFATLVTDQPGMSKFGSNARRGNMPIGVALDAELSKDLDPIVVRVREWTKGKKRNIRALLCSLTNVTWPECGWAGCQMHELVTPEQVKKAYRKAVLHIHPDKVK